MSQLASRAPGIGQHRPQIQPCVQRLDVAHPAFDLLLGAFFLLWPEIKLRGLRQRPLEIEAVAFEPIDLLLNDIADADILGARSTKMGGRADPPAHATVAALVLE